MAQAARTLTGLTAVDVHGRQAVIEGGVPGDALVSELASEFAHAFGTPGDQVYDLSYDGTLLHRTWTAEEAGLTDHAKMEFTPRVTAGAW